MPEPKPEPNEDFAAFLQRTQGTRYGPSGRPLAPAKLPPPAPKPVPVNPNRRAAGAAKRPVPAGDVDAEIAAELAADDERRSSLPSRPFAARAPIVVDDEEPADDEPAPTTTGSAPATASTAATAATQPPRATPVPNGSRDYVDEDALPTPDASEAGEVPDQAAPEEATPEGIHIEDPDETPAALGAPAWKRVPDDTPLGRGRRAARADWDPPLPEPSEPQADDADANPEPAASDVPVLSVPQARPVVLFPGATPRKPLQVPQPPVLDEEPAQGAKGKAGKGKKGAKATMAKATTKAGKSSGKGKAGASKSKGQGKGSGPEAGDDASDAPTQPLGAEGNPDTPQEPRYTIFLDRDGVFDRDRFPGVLSWSKFEWLPAAKESFAKLNLPDVQTCLVTNQPMASLLLLSRRRLQGIHARMKLELEEAGGRLDRIEVSLGIPFVPTRRRKPRPGMLEDAAKAFAIHRSPVDKSRSVLVGDRVKDAQAAAAFGIPCILVATTDPRAVLERKIAKARLQNVVLAADLPEAVALILKGMDA